MGFVPIAIIRGSTFAGAAFFYTRIASVDDKLFIADGSHQSAKADSMTAGDRDQPLNRQYRNVE